MKLVLSFIFLLSLLVIYLVVSDSPEEATLQVDASSTKPTPLQTEVVSLDAANNTPQENLNTQAESKTTPKTPEKEKPDLAQTETAEAISQEEDIHFSLSLDESTHHFIRGAVQADTGQIVFKSKRLPSNEVELSLVLKQDNTEDLELEAYFDLANFTMELDGKNGVLNKDHKQLLRLASSQIQSDFQAQYEGYDFPEHALMLTQMLSYWSLSPEGYVHEKRTIVSQ